MGGWFVKWVQGDDFQALSQGRRIHPVHIYSNIGYRSTPEAKVLADRASLVAQWLGVCLPGRGTRVRSLVREDPTCFGAAGPRAPQLLSLRSGARLRQLPKPARLDARTPHTGEATAGRRARTPARSAPGSLQLERARAQQQRPHAAKMNKQII